MTGFITDDQGEIITVFVPTGPNPTSGNIYHLAKDRVLKTGAPVDNGMKTIICLRSRIDRDFPVAGNTDFRKD